jgi:hypothetical protein
MKSHAATVRIAGLIGLLSALVNAVSDVILQGVPTGQYAADMEFMWQISEERLRFGALLGAFVIPFAIVGFWHVYQGIKGAGRIISLAPVLIGGYAAAVGSGVHYSLLHPALVGRVLSRAPAEAAPILRDLHSSMVSVNNQLFWVVTGFAIFSLWWMVLVFMGRTRYPRWAGALNPLFIEIVLGFSLPLIPGVGWYLFPATSALAFSVFFAFSIFWLWECDA